MGADYMWVFSVAALLLACLAVVLVEGKSVLKRHREEREREATMASGPRPLPAAPPLPVRDFDFHLRDPNSPVSFLADLVTRVGRIMSLRLGDFPSILVAKASIAEEALQEEKYASVFHSQFHVPAWRRLVGSHAHCVPTQDLRCQAFRCAAAKLIRSRDSLATAHNPGRGAAIAHALAMITQRAGQGAVVTVVDVCGPMVCDLMLLACFGEYPVPLGALASIQVRAALEGMATTGTASQGNPLLGAMEWIQGVRLLHRVHTTVKQRSYNFMLATFTSAVLPLIERYRFRHGIPGHVHVPDQEAHTPTQAAAPGRGSSDTESDQSDDDEEAGRLPEGRAGEASTMFDMDVSAGEDFSLMPSLPGNAQLSAFVSEMSSHGSGSGSGSGSGTGTDGRRAGADSSYLIPFLYAGRGMRMTAEETAAVCLEFLQAGYVTMTRALESAMSHIINHPQIQDKLFMEIGSVAGRRPVMEADLRNLHYLDAVVRETLRFNPPVPIMTVPSPTRACELAGFSIPHNATMQVHLKAIGEDPEVWSDPDRFIPERFLMDSTRELGRRMLPFGVANLSCPAKKLAAVTLKLAIARMVQSFRWNPPRDRVNARVPLGVPDQIPRSSVKASITART